MSLTTAFDLHIAGMTAEQCINIKYVSKYDIVVTFRGVTKGCRLSWLTNSFLVYEPECGGEGLWFLSQ
jgi:hypothetical protein